MLNESRILRALYEDMDVSLTKTSPFKRFYDVTGSRGVVYQVCISDEPSCTCPDFQNRRSRCKHQIKCLTLHLGCSIGDEALYDSKYIDIQTILPTDQDLDVGECSICFSTIWFAHAWTCTQCSNSFHRRCIYNWKRMTCPLCRTHISRI